MTAVAAAIAHERPYLRLVEPAPPQIEPWERHSELAIVSPEVRKHALERLPEREPYAFLERAPASARGPAPARSPARAAAAYLLLRVAQTARVGLTSAATLALLAAVAELLH